MSTAAARLSSHFKFQSIHLPVFHENSIHLTLVLIILFSALALIYIKDLNRRLFIQYQKFEQAYEQKTKEQQQLVLEKTTWSTHRRI